MHVAQPWSDPAVLLEHVHQVIDFHGLCKAEAQPFWSITDIVRTAASSKGRRGGSPHLSNNRATVSAVACCQGRNRKPNRASNADIDIREFAGRRAAVGYSAVAMAST
jgi:hypothetical protein